ncbi:hypothetical protein [Cupriavidus sp. D39]|uniref:hypothetical protein n=1 Tax=Cupriavidus sp. D39 TaxID=2997877 RepID=UPI00226FA094|nr:hypothetical protein [Cupriavidus sp. D39]MCY0854973.1 hypothetical protein [Cupriavidus sp. D39]
MKLTAAGKAFNGRRIPSPQSKDSIPLQTGRIPIARNVETPSMTKEIHRRHPDARRAPDRRCA